MVFAGGPPFRSTLAAFAEVEVQAEGFPLESAITYEQVGPPRGRFVLDPKGRLTIVLFYTSAVGIPYICLYEPEGDVEGKIVNGTPAKFVFTKQPFKYKGSNVNCQKKLKFSGSYEITDIEGGKVEIAK